MSEKNAWKTKATELGRLMRIAPWYIGDHINAGRAIGEDWMLQNLDFFGLSNNLITDYSYTAQRFTEEQRHWNLTIWHHREVASLADEVRERLLSEAEVKAWTTKELRRQKREYIELRRIEEGYYVKAAKGNN